MRKLIFLMGIVLAFGLSAQDIKLVKLEELNTLINTKSDQLKVINFWASWCGPCIKEMPHFDEVGQKSNVQLYFVSLDFASQKTKAEKMLAKQNIKSPALLLDEKDADEYITSINNDWSGAIPATLFISPSGKRSFYEQSLAKEELEEIVNNLKIK